MCDSINEVLAMTDLVFIFVATPSLPDGSYDHSQIDSVLDVIEEQYKGAIMPDKTIVICCTTMPGYSESVKKRFHNIRLNIVYNPEFIAQGDIINGLRYSDIVLMGGNPTEKLLKVYENIMIKKPNFKTLSLTGAELAKISINCFLTVKISYANYIGEIAINSGLEDEVDTILNTIGSDDRINNKYLKYGFGFQGICLSRDNQALGIHAKSVNATDILSKTTDEFNEHHYDYLKSKFILDHPDKNIPIYFDFLGYKKGVDILFNSQHYRLCKDLLELGYSVEITYEDSILPQVKEELTKYGQKVFVNIRETVNGRQ